MYFMQLDLEVFFLYKTMYYFFFFTNLRYRDVVGPILMF